MRAQKTPGDAATAFITLYAKKASYPRSKMPRRIEGEGHNDAQRAAPGLSLPPTRPRPARRRQRCPAQSAMFVVARCCFCAFSLRKYHPVTRTSLTPSAPPHIRDARDLPMPSTPPDGAIDAAACRLMLTDTEYFQRLYHALFERPRQKRSPSPFGKAE